MTDKILEETLDNGLRVRLKEIHSAPLISHWVWYKVGSRDEIPGKTGISHWVEHMQFKGTERFSPGVLDKAISRDGGVWNAFTYLDWTAYFETMPAAKINIALELESDRMVNSLFAEEEVESERTVIISEREGSENEPLFRLGEAIQKTSFSVHPYRFEVIGEKEDLHQIQRDDLMNHYHNYYSPTNAILVVAGDFNAQRFLKKIDTVYGKIPPGIKPARSITQETTLVGDKYLEVKGPGQTTYIQNAYRAPAANQQDFFPFAVLDSLLTGPTSLNMFGGGGISNKTSRLYRALVERELAVSIGGGMQATIDPYLYDISITVHPGRTVQEVLDALDHEIERICTKIVSVDEIARAIKQARALFVYGSENITNQAFWLGHAEMFSDYGWFTHYVEKLSSVTPQDVLRVAQKYLQPINRVRGVYIPDGNIGDGK